ncbi:MAG: hypothetical protein M1817_005071 [Caeruleum heppii]|nr:MAG: hypothetical protein M1817_005071 [Caeruleum heppii]
MAGSVDVSWNHDHHAGVKRRHEDDIENERRLSKRLELLKLARNEQNSSSSSAGHGASSSAPQDTHESMQLDDTPDKIYIHDLDEELSESEVTPEETVVFLPDIEKRLTKIPKSVLAGHATHAPDKQMVLYTVPTALTVPEEQDTVRKAIIETRARIRQQQAREMADVSVRDGPKTTMVDSSNGWIKDPASIEDDPDAMDIG